MIQAIAHGVHLMILFCHPPLKVTGPLGAPVTCTYGMIRETNTAVMEMSKAAGITLVTEKKRDPMNTTTFGVGGDDL